MRNWSCRVLRPDDLLSLRYVHDARLSKDARRVAYVVSRTAGTPTEETFEIVVEELGAGRRCRISFPGRATLPRWSPDGSRLAFVGSSGNSRRLYVADADAHGYMPLTSDEYEIMGPPSWSPDGSVIACTSIHRSKDICIRRINKRIYRLDSLGFIDDLSMSLHLVEAHGGGRRTFDVGPAVAMQPAFSPSGDCLLFLGSDSAVAYPALGGLDLFTVNLVSGEIRRVLGDLWHITAAAWSPCGNRIVYVGAYASELTIPTAGLWVVNRDGSSPSCRTEGLRAHIGMRMHHDMPTWDTAHNGNALCVPDAKHAYATVTRRGCTEIVRIALSGGISCESIIVGERSSIVADANSETSQLLYCACDLKRPWELFQYDLCSGREVQITRLNEDVIGEWPDLKVSHLEFESHDGFPLEGWYLSRADMNGPQPTVMFVHGGPFIATGHAFRYDFHLLAANGYAVLFANFRGSSGYGAPFARAIMGDWGARGFPDHMAAVDAAISRGLANPDRLGVWGASHGGFATCWIVGHTTRFCAAVADSAITNFVTWYYLSDVDSTIVKDLGGRPDEIPDVYRSRSPLTYAGRCRTPTLMLHGEEDMRTPIVEAEQFYRALQDAGCTTELVRIPGMSHMGDSTGPLSARVAQNEALLDWFERYL